MSVLLGETETIRLKLEDVVYKKKNGNVYITNERIIFLINGAAPDAPPKANIPIRTITTQKQSIESEQVIKLLLLTSDPAVKYVFVFSSKDDRDSMKQKISALLRELPKDDGMRLEDRKVDGAGSTTPVPPSPAIDPERLEMLKSDLDLLKLHKELVGGNVVTEEEFWESRMREKEMSRAPKGPVGIPSDVLEKLHEKTGSSEKQVVTLNPTMIDSIFRTYPKVKKAYQENVPDKVSMESFWTQFLETQLFFRRQGKIVNDPLQEILSQSLLPDRAVAVTAEGTAEGKNGDEAKKEDWERESMTSVVAFEDHLDGYGGYGGREKRLRDEEWEEEVMRAKKLKKDSGSVSGGASASGGEGATGATPVEKDVKGKQPANKKKVLRRHENPPLARLFNQQSTAVLGTSMDTSSNGTTSQGKTKTSSFLEQKRQLMAAVDLDDLRRPTAPNVVPLQPSALRLVSSRAPATSSSASVSAAERAHSHSRSSLSLPSRLAMHSSGLTATAQSRINALYDHTRSSNTAPSLSDLSSDAQGQLRQLHSVIHELLRHIWSRMLLSSAPTPQTRSRLSQLIASLAERHGQLCASIRTYGDTFDAAAMPLLKAVTKVTDEYARWQLKHASMLT